MHAQANCTLSKTRIALMIACLTGITGLATAADLFKAGKTVVYRNDITVTNNVKYVNYLYTGADGGETLHVTLPFKGSCLVEVCPLIAPEVCNGGATFVSLGSRVPNGFTPKGVTGTLANVVLDNTVSPHTVSFDLTFATLKDTGSKQFGVAHLDLNLAVDDDCNAATDDVPLKIGVQVSASTASHP
jgi:hypothetical protein